MGKAAEGRFHFTPLLFVRIALLAIIITSQKKAMQEAIEKERLLSVGEVAKTTVDSKRKKRAPYTLPTAKSIWTISVVLSLFLNCTLTWLVAYQQKQHESIVSAHRSEHASLPRDLIDPYYEETPYSNSMNDSLAAALWHDIDIDSGVIALSDDYVISKNLLPAQRFPWDDTKGIYIVHGYHNLHCLKIIYISLHEYRLGEAQSRRWTHISHCFDALRRQVLCDADDTPRAVQRELDGISGVGQFRKCRDWSRLEEWAKQHTACYRRPEKPVEGMRNIEKYKHCPDGSEYEVQ